MYRIGHAKDTHKLVENRDLILGGILFEYPLGLLGHSDADVLLHAIIESIIGAMALGDIGTFFPDTDAKFKGIDSMVLLKETIKIMNEYNYEIVNIDATIYLEEPKMRPYIDVMRENIAKNINIELNQINIKATRGEGLGYIGRMEGISSECVCLLRKKND